MEDTSNTSTMAVDETRVQRARRRMRSGHYNFKYELLQAITHRDIDEIKFIIEIMRKLRLNHLRIAALHHIAALDDIKNDKVIETLIECNYSLHQQNVVGDTPLHIACRNGALHNVELFLAHGSPLKVKNKKNNYPLEEMELLCPRAWKYLRRNLHRRLNMDLVKDLDYYLENDENDFQDMIYRYQLNVNLQIVKKFINYGATFDATDKCDFKTARKLVTFGTKEMLHILVASGFDITAVDANGSSLLHFAVTSGNAENTKELLKFIDVNAFSKKFGTPLQIASFCGWQSCVALLLEAGANIEARIRDNDTPIHYAILSNNPTAIKVIKRLLLRKCDLQKLIPALVNYRSHVGQRYLQKPKVKKLFIEHIMALYYAGLHVAEPLISIHFLKYSNPTINCSYYFRKYQTEVRKMKEMVFYGKFSAYHFLVKDPKVIAHYLNIEVEVFFESGSYSLKFPLYADYLLSAYIAAHRLRKVPQKFDAEL